MLRGGPAERTCLIRVGDVLVELAADDVTRVRVEALQGVANVRDLRSKEAERSGLSPLDHMQLLLVLFLHLTEGASENQCCLR